MPSMRLGVCMHRTFFTGMGWPSATIMSVLWGSGAPQRPQNTPTVALSRRDSRSDPAKLSTCTQTQPRDR